MTELILTQTRDPIKRIRELVTCIQQLDQASSQIDISNVEYITPLTILPLASLVSRMQKERRLVFHPSESQRLTDLLEYGFPQGKSIQEIKPMENFVPICSACMSLKTPRESIALLNNVAEQYRNSIVRLLNQKQEVAKNYQESIIYFLSELCDNVNEHSEAENFWVFSIFWVKRKELEICVLDDGIGIKRCYDKRGIGTSDHVDALAHAVEGVSSKGEERGYGLGSNIRLFTSKELLGEVCLISGDACYFKSAGSEAKLGTLPINWRGLIFNGRLRRPSRQVSVLPYASG